MEAAGIVEFEKVLVANITNGQRFETYALKGKRSSGTICLNGAVARLASVGDTIIIFAFALAEPNEKIKPKIIVVDRKNMVAEVLNTG